MLNIAVVDILPSSSTTIPQINGNTTTALVPHFQRRKCRSRIRQQRPPRLFLLAFIVLLSFLPSNSRIGTPNSHINTTPFPFFASATSITPLHDTDDTASSLPANLRGVDAPSESDRHDKLPFNRKPPSLNKILLKAGKRGLGGGIPGAIAGVVQVLTMMWLRTITIFQYRYGAPFFQTVRMLYNEGGVPRFYRGLLFALVQAPLARFGSTAANDGVEALVKNVPGLEEWGPGRWILLSSFMVGLWRVVIMPLDTCKTVLQVDAAEGFRNLIRKVRLGKIGVLYQGAFAAAVSSIISHYPWFYTYNVLSKNDYVKSLIKSPLLLNAGIGFLASVVSDTVTNCIRVVKTTKQAVASKHVVGYGEAINMILAADGWKGLFGRGLRTRILGNGFQSIVFTVVWRGLSGRLFKDKESEEEDTAIEDDVIPKES